MSTSKAMQHKYADLTSSVYITETAVQQLQKLHQKEIECKNNDVTFYFRITVLSGGCSGFQYNFDFSSTQPKVDEVLFYLDNVKVLIDKISLGFLENITLDYSKQLIGEAFTLVNPNAQTSCGCGNSFMI